MLRSAIFAALIVHLLINASYSQTIKDLTITANKLTYSEDGTSIEATGSVEVISKENTITADHIICTVSPKRVIADSGYQMITYNGLKLEGKYLDYNFDTKKGHTRDLKMTYRYSVIDGSMADFDEEKIELKEANFNTCGLQPPHYHIYAMTTTVYPNDGWVIGYLGYLYVQSVPLVPVPVYLLDLSMYGTAGQKKESTDVLAVPEVGSNDEDGNYIVERVPWIGSRKLHGRVMLMDSENGKLAGGVEGLYSADDYNDINFRLYYDPRYDFFGGLTHTYRFGPTLAQQQERFYTFFQIKQQLMMELQTNLSVKERINYERVTMLPEITLKVNDVPALMEHFRIGGSISYAHITEETSGANADEANLKTTGYFNIPTDYGRIYAGLGFNQSWYIDEEIWIRMTQNLKLSRDLAYGFDGYIGHMHYLIYEGNSPFRYERYYVLPSDEFSVGLGYNFWEHRLGADYTYYVPDNEPKDLDYSISFKIHCYSLDMRYRATRKEFLFGVSLITR